MKTEQKVLINDEGTRYIWSAGDFHTKDGFIKETDIKKHAEVSTSKGKHYLCFPAQFPDLFQTVKRGPAVILPKEVGLIIAIAGIGSATKIVEAGTGSGFLAAYLAHITPKLVSYERNKDFYVIAQKNLKKLNIKAKLKNKDISQGIDERNIDVIILDLEEPLRVVKHAHKALRAGGFLILYQPHISQVQEGVITAQKEGFYHQLTTELIQRDWIVEEKKLRPKHIGLMHTGFLTFLRKI